MQKKGQIIITDLAFSLFIFLILFIGYFIEWNRTMNRLDSTIQFNDLELRTLQISDLLTRSPGVPSNWETTPASATLIGLAEKDRILSPAKVHALTNLSYNQTKTLFNIPELDFYLLIKKNNLAIAEIGVPPTQRAVHLQRIVRYQNEKATLNIALSKRN